MVLQNYQNFIELTSNMIYIVALAVGLKCPHKIHLNTKCPPPLWKDVVYGRPLTYCWKNPVHLVWQRPVSILNKVDKPRFGGFQQSQSIQTSCDFWFSMFSVNDCLKIFNDLINMLSKPCFWIKFEI